MGITSSTFDPQHNACWRPCCQFTLQHIVNLTKMNGLLPTHPSSFSQYPLHHHDAHQNLASPHTPSRMSTRKRKADDDGHDDSMSISPQASPAFAARPLALPRLLETLDADSLRSVLHTICERHPQIGSEVVASAPRPSVDSTVEVLSKYQDKL